MYLLVKAAISGILVALASEGGAAQPGFRRPYRFAASVSILALISLWRDTTDVAALAQSTFWFVLPSLPMFLVLPVLLRQGMGFWPSLGLMCFMTIVLYGLTFWLLTRLGIAH